RGIEARMVQVEAVAEHEADARCDDRIPNAELEYPDRIARGQPLTDIIEKRPRGTTLEAVWMNRAERHLGTQGMQLQETQQRPAHLDRIACHNELEGVAVAPQRVLAAPHRPAHVASQSRQ